MLRKSLYLFVALLACVAMLSPILAQDQGASRGNLGGVVYDSSNAVVPDSKVSITGPIGTLSQMSNGQGEFLFSTLIPGVYSLKVEKQGFKISEFKAAEVVINKTLSIRVVLETGQLTQTVEVEAATLTVDSTSSAVSSDFSDSLYENLPISRGVTSLFYLAPGVASGLGTGNANPSISGASGLENLYVADGVAINDPAFGGLGVFSRVYGPLGTGINLSFVKEVQVKTAGFEPQYGHSSGGIVQIVTKSGGTSTHGAIAGYFQRPEMSTLFSNADDFNPVNLIGRHLHDASYEGDIELGGYVPVGKLRDHLFYFGTFNPTFRHDYEAPALGSGLFTIYKGQVDRRTNTMDYAGKLTLKLSQTQTIESSVFGDPSHTNHVPWSTLNSDNASANSKWDFGTRNWVVRYDGVFGSSWLVDGAFTWNWNHFTETPASDIYGITDDTQIAGLAGQRGAFNAQGIGYYEPYDSSSKGFNFDTSKGFSFAGKHTISIGYAFQKPVYDDIVNRSGPRFIVPAVNATGGTYLSPQQQADLGTNASTNATFGIFVVNPNNPAFANCTLCPLLNVPGYTTPQQIYVRQTRGTFSNGVTHSSGLYHAAYLNDSWSMGRHVTLNTGLRWEQQRVNGNQAGANFKNMWEPRVSFIVDPKGDRKSKIYASFGRYAYVLPLDIALRSLSSENDIQNLYFAPDSTGGFANLNSLGTVNVITDAAHLLNKANGGINKRPVVSAQSGGEPFVPGTKMEYNDEFVVGAEHEFRGGIVASVRYVDRRLKRVIEDFSGISIEGAVAGLSQTYVIGNPSATTDFVTNPNEITFKGGVGNEPAACKDSNGNLTPFIAYDNTDTFGNVVGSACFPSVNLNPWTDASGNVLAGALFGGEVGADGKPDGFNTPLRNYQAIEFEVNKSLSHNWALVANWRIARLQGNYEGAFRNDNGQGDPGISSLFDFTPGQLGLLGFQQGNGVLNSDRKHVVNVYTTYIIDRSRAKGLVLGAGVKIASGVPLTTLAAQEAYGNPGEVPLFGRGDLGRAPVTGTVDAHMEYPLKISERVALKFGIDLFNIANTKRVVTTNQFVDLQFGSTNADFKKPSTFVPSFNARGMVRLEF
ncbi:MAG: hypothetical protein PVS2B2_23380 [Candidatus Acidiferrum sp.]